MSELFTSDLHLSHKLITSHRGFKTIDEMNDKLFSMFDSCGRSDRIFILGDVSFELDDAQRLFDYLLKTKRVDSVTVIQGNHDKWTSRIAYHPRLKIYQTMFLKPQKGTSGLFLSHYPQIIFDKSHYNAFQLHGHGHSDTSDRPLLDNLVLGKRLNVNCELHDYKLWNREEIEEYMKSMPNNIDYYLCKGSDKQKEKVEKFLTGLSVDLKNLFEELGEVNE